MTENIQSATFTVEQILKSKQAFSDYVETRHDEISTELAKNYSQAIVHVTFAQLTQNIEGFCNFAELPKAPCVFWYVVNEKEEVVKIVEKLNSMFSKGCGIFVIKASLNDGEITFTPLVSPKSNWCKGQ